MTRALTLLLSVAAVAPASHAAGQGPIDTSVSGDITVFAAASLTDAFNALGEEFEARHAGTSVTLSFAASSDLVTQIVEGAPVDVFASADRATMDRLVEAVSTEGEPSTFATNSLAIIVESGNPLDITGVDDLTDPDLLLVTCAPEVPIGAYTQQLFDAAGVEISPDSLEENVRGIVGKVVSGEADAGVVYSTDVIAAGDDADGVAIPPEQNVVVDYPIAALTDAPDGAGATAFVQFVLGDEGQDVLADFGFGPPGGPDQSSETTVATATSVERS